MLSTYLGIDVGTSATRVALIDETGRVLREATSGYSTNIIDGGGAEQDPAWWLNALQGALDRVDVRTLTPDAIGLCGQTPTLVFCDAKGESSRASLTWQDNRATVEADELSHVLGAPEPYFGTGLPWSASNMPAKLKWLARREPELVASTQYILQPKDYVGMALTGVPTSDGWSSKGLCNVLDGRPAETVLLECGWSPKVCPPIDFAWARRGVVTEVAAKRFGLVSGTPVSVGWSDALSEILAAGAFARESAFVFTGTSSIVGATVHDQNVRAGGLFSVPIACAPIALLYGPTQAGGAALVWASTLLGCSVEELVSMASLAADSPTFVPYLYGERAPLWDSEVRSIFAGISARHGRAEFARATVMGVVSAARNLLDMVVNATGEPLSKVEVAGRGVGDASWETMAYEGLGLDLRFHHDAELSVRGAAMLAMAVDGVDIVEASTLLVDTTHEIPSSPRSAALAREGVDRFRRATDLAVQWRNVHSQSKELP